MSIDFLEKDKNFLMALKENNFNQKQTKRKGYPLNSACIANSAKVSDRKQVKILIPKQKDVKVGSTSENLLNKICQIIYFLHQAKRTLTKNTTT